MRQGQVDRSLNCPFWIVLGGSNTANVWGNSRFLSTLVHCLGWCHTMSPESHELWKTDGSWSINGRRKHRGKKQQHKIAGCQVWWLHIWRIASQSEGTAKMCPIETTYLYTLYFEDTKTYIRIHDFVGRTCIFWGGYFLVFIITIKALVDNISLGLMVSVRPLAARPRQVNQAQRAWRILNDNWVVVWTGCLVPQNG